MHKGTTTEGVLLDCETCGFVHVPSYPSSQEIEQYYRKKFYASSKPTYIKESERDRDWLSFHYKERLRMIRSFIDPEFSERFLMMDVGCGAGVFLECSQEDGWDSFGVEAGDAAYAHCVKKELPVVHDYLCAGNYHNLPVCLCIHMDQVLEHSPEPITLLKICHRLLWYGGILCLCIPNEFNKLQLLDSRRWWIAPPEHLNYFTPSSIKLLLEKLDFQVLDITSTFPMELFLLLGEDYVSSPRVGKSCHRKRMRLERKLGWGNLRPLYSLLAANSLGRELVVYARKPT